MVRRPCLFYIVTLRHGGGSGTPESKVDNRKNRWKNSLSRHFSRFFRFDFFFGGLGGVQPQGGNRAAKVPGPSPQSGSDKERGRRNTGCLARTSDADAALCGRRKRCWGSAASTLSAVPRASEVAAGFPVFLPAGPCPAIAPIESSAMQKPTQSVGSEIHGPGTGAIRRVAQLAATFRGRAPS